MNEICADISLCIIYHDNFLAPVQTLYASIWSAVSLAKPDPLDVVLHGWVWPRKINFHESVTLQD